MTTEYASEMDHLVHALFSAPGLTEEAAAGMVRSMRHGRYFPRTPERYAEAIEHALARPDSITAKLEPPYSEAEVRAFFAMVHEELHRKARGADHR